MSNDSREFEAWKERMIQARVRYSDFDIWQAAQSRHAAEREALEAKINNLMTQMLALEDSNVQLTKERDALLGLPDSGSQG